MQVIDNSNISSLGSLNVDEGDKIEEVRNNLHKMNT